MKTQFKKFPVIITFIILNAFLFSRCNEALDCIAKVQPKLPDKEFVTGKIGIEYYDSLKASAINSTDDDGFSYNFNITGKLPPGINYFIEHRKIYFRGVPTEKGVFSFTIVLSIGDSIIVTGDHICFSGDSTSKTYRITIN